MKNDRYDWKFTCARTVVWLKSETETLEKQSMRCDMSLTFYNDFIYCKYFAGFLCMIVTQI